MSDRATLLRLLHEHSYADSTEKAVIAEESISRLFDSVKDELYAEVDALRSRAEKAEAKVKEWQTVAEMLADELNECNSERRPISWEDASESSPAWIAYVNLRDRR